MRIPTGGTARKPLRGARFGAIPKPTVKEAMPSAVWMGKGASMKGSTDKFSTIMLAHLFRPAFVYLAGEKCTNLVTDFIIISDSLGRFVPPEENSSGGIFVSLCLRAVGVDGYE